MENSEAIWDAVQDNIFVDICLEEIAAHDIVPARDILVELDSLIEHGILGLNCLISQQPFRSRSVGSCYNANISNYVSFITPGLIPSWSVFAPFILLNI